jgi:hypothetical protein
MQRKDHRLGAETGKGGDSDSAVAHGILPSALNGYLTSPGPREVIVEIRASSMCGGDLKFYRAVIARHHFAWARKGKRPSYRRMRKRGGGWG